MCITCCLKNCDVLPLSNGQIHWCVLGLTNRLKYLTVRAIDATIYLIMKTFITFREYKYT